MNDYLPISLRLGPSRAFTTDAMLELEAQLEAPTKEEITPESFFQEALRVFNQNYLCDTKCTLLHADLTDHFRKFSDNIDSFAKAEKAIKAALVGVTDDYTVLRTKSQIRHELKNVHATGVVSATMLEKNIGYIKIDSFVSRHTSDEFAKSLTELADARAYILDLRGNRGGFIDQVEDIYSYFVKTRLLLSVTGWSSGKHYQEVIRLNPWQYISDTKCGRSYGFPRKGKLNEINDKRWVVLVNEETRSAAEMLACCLWESGQAQLVGTRTYGKAVLQQTLPIGRGYVLRVTSAVHQVANFIKIHKLGLHPDYVVANDEGSDKQLAFATAMLQ